MSHLKTLRAEPDHLNDLLADTPAHEAASFLARLREEVKRLGITEQEICQAPGYDRPTRVPPKFYDPVSGSTWSGRGSRPKWLRGKRLEDYAIDASPPPSSRRCWA